MDILDSRDIQIQELIKSNLKLMEENSILKVRVTELEDSLSKYKNPKNSRNSSVPPSKDENRSKKTQSLRGKSDRKSGGQPGHKGHTLEMTASPDFVTEHIPGFCRCCGHDLSAISAELSSVRQVIDIPVIRPECREHRSYFKICPCGEKTKSEHPVGVNAPIQYGSGIESLVGYLHSRQYLPYRRMKEFFKDCLGIALSEGSIDNIIQRFSCKALPVYGMLATTISNSTVIGCDETGAKVDGVNHWVWAYQTESHTFLAMSPSRGLKAIKSHFPDGFGDAILCHDAWRTYFHYSENLHQLCFAHLLRELNYIEERYQSEWAENLKALMKKAIILKKTIAENPLQCQKKRIIDLEKSLDDILAIIQIPEHTEAVSLQKRFLKYRNSIFTFLYHLKVPPDNNASERAIRNVKVKQKISGQFKSVRGADDFCVIRSVVDTLIKQSENVMENLNLIAKLVPE